MPGDYTKLTAPEETPTSPVPSSSGRSDTSPSRGSVSGKEYAQDDLSRSSLRTSTSSKDALDHLDALDDPLDIADAAEDFENDDEVPLFGPGAQLLTDHEGGLVREARARRSMALDAEEGLGYRLPTDGGGILNSFFNM